MSSEVSRLYYRRSPEAWSLIKQIEFIDETVDRGGADGPYWTFIRILQTADGRELKSGSSTGPTAL